ncbi:MAG: ATP-dependent helicase [Candidatus Eisenbacteria bacterium]
MHAFPDLNPEQRAAVEHRGGPLLVVAGAGSGKTRVLTARVASLLDEGVPAERILAFTFTNRAAREMRERIARAVRAGAERVWVGTFHATGVRMLRRETRALAARWPGFPADFSIFDREDQETLLREVMKRLELPEGAYRLGEVLGRISDAKNALVTPTEAERAAVTPYEKHVAECYALYQASLRRQGAMDFDDLIAEVVLLLRDDPATGARYAGRFEHVLVDEYQDTNHAQFRLVAALAAGHGNLFVVGDDDQSIYGWRGADLANVLDFEDAFPGARVIRLERNYRSTANILRAANAVIAHNRSRKGKTLWCEREDGPRLRFQLARDEADEARRIADLIVERRRRGRALADCAVLYRTNAQSRALETELRHRGLRYEIVGGVSFYQRREVKDVLAYLRLAVNPGDTTAFARALNTPRRGLGEAVTVRVERRLAEGGTNPIEALRSLAATGELGRARAGAEVFLAVVDHARACAGEPVDRVMTGVLEDSGYLRLLDELPRSEGAERRGNVEELRAAAAAFAAGSPDPSLGAFLAETALITDLDRVEEGEDRVLLLTAHNAKGLEFPIVVVAGLEEGLMPHASALDDPKELEEERRLFYVALTRAQDEVHLTAAAYRRRFDGGTGGQVSRFVTEIPDELIEHDQPTVPLWGRGAAGAESVFPDDDWGAGGARARGRHGGARDGAASARRGRGGGGGSGGPVAPAYRTTGPLIRFVGREVRHEVFGRGVVMAAEQEAGDVKFTVRFGAQVKKVLGRYLDGGHDDDPA